MERGLLVFPVAFDGSELARLPALLHGVIGRIEGETVGVKMRVGPAFNGPGGEMKELAPNEIAGFPIFLSVCDPYPRSHLRLDLAHGFSYRYTEGPKNPIISGESMDDRNVSRTVEIKVITDPAIIFRPS
jgi:hypothetical protein